MEYGALIQYLVYASLGISIIIPLAAIFTGRTSKAIAGLAWIAILSFTGSAILVIASPTPQLFYGGLVQHDNFTGFMMLAAALSGAIAMLAAGREPLFWESSPAYYSLLPLALAGTFFLLGAVDALLVLATWLLVSVISYVIVALPAEKESRAAAIRYILLGAIATLLLAVWAAGQLIVTSQAGLEGFTIAPLSVGKTSALAFAALIAALGFKLGVVPFHWWLPSVYGKADGKVIAVVSSVIKIAFIGILARIILLSSGNPFAAAYIAVTLAILAVATMTYGNIAALTTDRLQRLLAYSSIAHVGYLLAAMAALAYGAAASDQVARLALAAIAVQSIAYGAAKAALFGMVSPGRDSFEDIRGLLGGDKWTGIAAATLLLSLLGLPPLLGFWGKLYMFQAAAGYSIILVAAALINSAISSAYYVRAIRELIAEGEPKATPTPAAVAAVRLAALITIVLGLIAPLLVGIIP